MRNFATKLFQKTTQNNSGRPNNFLNEVLVPRIKKSSNLQKARIAKSTIKMQEKNGGNNSSKLDN